MKMCIRRMRKLNVRAFYKVFREFYFHMLNMKAHINIGLWLIEAILGQRVNMGLTRACLCDKHRLNRGVRANNISVRNVYISYLPANARVWREKKSGLNTRCWFSASARLYLMLFLARSRLQKFNNMKALYFYRCICRWTFYVAFK